MVYYFVQETSFIKMYQKCRIILYRKLHSRKSAKNLELFYEEKYRIFVNEVSCMKNDGQDMTLIFMNKASFMKRTNHNPPFSVSMGGLDF